MQCMWPTESFGFLCLSQQVLQTALAIYVMTTLASQFAALTTSDSSVRLLVTSEPSQWFASSSL